MKTKSTLTVAVIVVLTLSYWQPVNAQYWNLSGNSTATTSSKLGTTNSVPLKFTTNNSTRAYIDGSTGNFSIGNGSAASSSYRLYVTGSSSGIYGKGSTNYGIYGQGGAYGVYGTGSTYGLYGKSTSTGSNSYGVYGSGNTGVYGLSSVDGGIGVYGKSIHNSTIGIGVLGTCDYGRAVEGISSGGDGVGGFFSGTLGDGLYAETSEGGYGIYAQGDTSYSTGVYGYGGYGGVGGGSYDGYGGYFHSTNSSALYAQTDNGFYAGEFYGNILVSGEYNPSDRRLKKNIEDVGNAMSIINKLQPKHYEYKNDAQYAALHLPAGMHYGLIAQDLEQVLPNLVHEQKLNIPVKTEIVKPRSADGKGANPSSKSAPVKTESMDVKAVNYEELIPILIKAIQEQNGRIEALTQQVNALTASKQSVTNNASTAIKLSSASLDQNNPNPFAGATTIRYSVPASFRTAQIIITDNSGKTIKQVQLNTAGTGTINIDASTLGSGTYSYSLVVDGKVIESKKMIVAH